MLSSALAAHLQHQIEAQLELAGLAPFDQIRAMHEDLEKLYRARLVAVVLAERLVAVPNAPRSTAATPLRACREPARAAKARPCTSTF